MEAQKVRNIFARHQRWVPQRMARDSSQKKTGRGNKSKSRSLRYRLVLWRPGPKEQDPACAHCHVTLYVVWEAHTHLLKRVVWILILAQVGQPRIHPESSLCHEVEALPVFKPKEPCKDAPNSADGRLAIRAVLVYAGSLSGLCCDAPCVSP